MYNPPNLIVKVNMCYYSFFERVKPLMKAWSNTNNTITEQQYAKINNARYMRYRKG